MKTVLKVLLWVLIGITVGLVGWTAYKGGADELIGYNLLWAYGLLALAVVGVIVAALIDTITHPAGLIKTLLGVVVVVAVVGTALGLVLSEAPVAVPNSAGGVFDNAFELRISEIGIYVTYIVAAIAILVVVFDVLSGLVRRVLK
jgi:hypothetical protein